MAWLETSSRLLIMTPSPRVQGADNLRRERQTCQGRHLFSGLVQRQRGQPQFLYSRAAPDVSATLSEDGSVVTLFAVNATLDDVVTYYAGNALTESEGGFREAGRTRRAASRHG